MKKQNQGIALIIVMGIAAIILILSMAFFIQTNVAVKTSLYEKSISLAETGSETARGWAEEQTANGHALPQWATTSPTISSSAPTISASAVPLSFATGGNVNFSSQELNTLGPTTLRAYGVPVTVPIYNSAGTQIGTKTDGYFAFEMHAGTRIQIFAIGAVGDNPNQIVSVRELHVIIKPVSYTTFNYFEGDPNQPVALFNNSPDAITNQPLTTTCSPCTGDTLYTSGSDIPGGNSFYSFDKSYSAGQMVVLPPPSTNNELTGMSSADYYFSLNNSQDAVAAGSNVYMPNGGNSGIWTGNQSIGLPTASGNGTLTNVMQTLFNNAVNSGLFIYDPFPNERVSASNTDWVPYPNWDPQTSMNEVNIVVSNPGDPMSCNNGPGDIKVTSNGQWLVYYLNGQANFLSPNSSICVNSTTLQDHIVYTDGNMGIQSYWNGNTASLSGGYAGNMSYVSPGKITITGDLTSQSFLNDNSSYITSGTVPSTPFNSSGSDVSGLITPYQINVNPTNPNHFTNTMVLEQLGSPSTIPWSWSDHLGSDSANYFTVNFSGSNNLSGSSSPSASNGYLGSNIYSHCSSGNCSNYLLYGTQIQYFRSSPPYSNYNNIYEPFDINLLQREPPYSPIISAGYDIVYWEVVNRVTGQDMNYDNLP